MVSSVRGWAAGIDVLEYEAGAWGKSERSEGPFGFIQDIKMIDEQAGRAIAGEFSIHLSEDGWIVDDPMVGGNSLALAGPNEAWAVSEEALFHLSEGVWSDPITDESVHLGGQGIALEGKNVWIAGTNPISGEGQIVAYNAEDGPFEIVEFPGSTRVADLAIFPSGRGFAVGESSQGLLIFERIDGEWSQQDLPIDGEFSDLEMLNESVGAAVGFGEDESGELIGFLLQYDEGFVDVEPTPSTTQTAPSGNAYK